MKTYRLGVVGAFINDEDKILLCKRSDLNDVWQLPQGGIEQNESPETAFNREMYEELGCSSFSIIGTSGERTRYDFPPDMKAPIAKKFDGQEHIWFLARFHDGHQPDLRLADGEFIDWQWTLQSKVVGMTVAWKRDAYRRGLLSLGINL